MRKLFFWIPIIAGTAAALLMLRRGESLGTIAKKATTNPMGTLLSELKSA